MKPFFLILLLSIKISYSQIEDYGNPISWENKSLSSTDFIDLPLFNLNEHLNYDSINKDEIKSYRFGYEHIVNDDLSEGRWTILPSGDKIWQIAYHSSGAISMNVVFDKFKLAQGAYLIIHNQEYESKDGAYTYKNNNINNQLGTSLVRGDKVVIELFEPKNPITPSILHVKKIVHGYKDINNWLKQKVNESGACNLDIICVDTANWQNQANSVVRIVNGGSLCTGTLINNTNNDGTPYVLTANHCNPQNMGTAVFRFDYKSPICGSQTANDSHTANSNRFINGSSLVARRESTDFGLIKLNQIPPNNYELFYSGWDITNSHPSSAVSIHHPKGDVMKISFDDDPLSSTNFGSQLIMFNAHYWFIESWERNTTTEGGSSGAALFNKDKKVIGQLRGGTAKCGNELSDWYGKLSASWDGDSSTNRLRDWLNPNNSEVKIINGYKPKMNLIDASNKVDLGIKLYPNPANNYFYVSCNSNEPYSISLINSIGKKIHESNQQKSEEIIINTKHFPRGFYFVKITTMKKVIFEKIILK